MTTNRGNPTNLTKIRKSELSLLRATHRDLASRAGCATFHLLASPPATLSFVVLPLTYIVQEVLIFGV